MILADGRRKTKVVFVQLGSPKSPAVSDVRHYLKEFLADPRVVDINPILWKIILNCFVLPFRPARSAALYSRIWDKERQSFPLLYITEEFTEKVRRYLPGDKVEVNHAFLLSPPSVADVWDSWEQDIFEKGDAATKLMVIPMFPQYSESTIASGADGFFGVLSKRVQLPPFEFLTNWHRSKVFIDQSVKMIDAKIAEFEKSAPVDALIISFHGIPKRRVISKKDAYYQHCFETFFLLREKMQSLHPAKVHMTFQSRFGSEEWLTPYTDDFAVELCDEGKQRIAVYCPSFVADCLETIDEIGTELQEEIEPHGGEVLFIPCLNAEDEWCQNFATFVYRQAEASEDEKAEDFYVMKKEDYQEMPEPKMSRPELTPAAKKTLKIVFLTLFLDLVGFSIIFPLFPALAKHYLEVDPNNFFLRLIYDGVTSFAGSGGSRMSGLVLFGGALGALYSLCQFIAAPIWGTISDRIGRRPVLLISVFALALSYLLWGFAGSFTTLIFARLIGGIMGGNISTASAVVADVTQKENRSKGMATIGIAFALGFIIGPAMGGILAMWNPVETFPSLAAYGVNPFSVPAFLAFALSMINFVWLWKKFEETLPAEKRGQGESERSLNPLKLFAPLPYQGVNKTNFGHFLFLMAFSGMEFTLTFLAFERLGFEPLDNGLMFIFIGFLIAMVQGGFVRRKAGQIGEKKVALMGLAILIPGLVAIGFTTSTWLLYFGLFFLAVGSAMAIPTLTSLVSLYTPGEHQGRSLGIFRSLGALARVIGPILASLCYWKFGSGYPYFIGSLFLLVPIFLVATLPRPEQAAAGTVG